MRSHRAALVFSLPVVLLGLLLSAQPARAAWKAVGYEVEYTYTAPFSETVKKNVLDKDLGLIVYTVGKRTLQTEAGWVTATAECYSNALPNGHPVAYEFGLGGDADKRLKIKLEATGPSGPRPPTWLQQSYCHSESHHDLVQYPDDQGNLPSPWWGIERVGEESPGYVLHLQGLVRRQLVRRMGRARCHHWLGLCHYRLVHRGEDRRQRLGELPAVEWQHQGTGESLAQDVGGLLQVARQSATRTEAPGARPPGASLRPALTRRTPPSPRLPSQPYSARGCALS